jgi:hypothetical protein
MRRDSPDASGLRVIWDLLRGAAVPEQIPAGISRIAARHGCGAALYSALEDRGLRAAVDATDWSLLRGFAFFHRARARRSQALLHQLAAGAPPGAPWLVWKGAALLVLLPGYDRLFEAGDIDVAVRRGELEAWLGHLIRNGAVITKRSMAASGLEGFQARFPGPDGGDEPTLVLDVKAADRMPELETHAGVPVPARERHLDLLREHSYKHAVLPAPRLRMLYDAYLLGAGWCEDLYRSLFGEGGPAAAGGGPRREPLDLPRAEGTRRITADRCVVLVDAYPSFQYDPEGVERSLPRLLPGAGEREAVARLDVRLEPAAEPYAIEERSDRTVLWVRSPLSAREGKRLICAMAQRAYQSIELMTLHCTVVAREGRAVALLGSFGAGKTITSLRMCEAGGALIAGDAGLIAVGDEARAIGGTRAAWVDRAVRDRYFPHLAGRDPEASGMPRVDLAPSMPWPPAVTAPPALVGLVFVTVTPVRAEDCFTTLMPEETAALNLFRASSYRFDTLAPSCALPLSALEPRAQRPWRVDRCQALAGRVKAYRVGGSVEYAAGVALSLLE